MTLPQRLEQLNLPRRHEDWRWTDLSAAEAALSAEPANDAAPDATPYLIDGIEGPVLLFVDGKYIEAASRPGAVRVEKGAARDAANGPLAEIAAQHSLHKISLGGSDQRVQIVHIATGGQAHLDLQYVVAAGDTARVVETYAGGGESWVNLALSASVAESGRLRRAVRILQDAGAWTETVNGRLAADAHFGSVSLIGAAAAVRSEYDFVLGDRAHAQVDGTMVAGARQHFDVVGRIRHQGVGGSSGQTWRSVVAGKAQASFAGRIEVARGAQQTDANEDVKAILLDRTATANAKPELEIFADDVKCAHGATVGELDKRALFYMESRGLPPERARQLLTEAFVADAFEAVENADLRAALGEDARRLLERVR